MCGNVGKCGGILWRVPRQQVALHLLVDSPTTQLPPTRPLSNYHANGNEERDDENKRSKQLLTAYICCWQLKTVFESSKQLFRPPDPCPTTMPMAKRSGMMRANWKNTIRQLRGIVDSQKQFLTAQNSFHPRGAWQTTMTMEKEGCEEKNP